MRPVRFSAAVGCALWLAACASKPAVYSPVVLPRDGSVSVVFDQHLPDTLPISRLLVVLDGTVLYKLDRGAGSLTSRHHDVFHGRISDGEHTVQILVNVDVPCGMTKSPHGTLSVRAARTIIVRGGGTSLGGGVIRFDAFSRAPWLDPQESVHLETTRDGLGESTESSSYARQKLIEAYLACAASSSSPLSNFDRPESARCFVRTLLERARVERDVIAVLCYNDKLARIDVALRRMKDDPKIRVQVESEIGQLVAETENCIGEDGACWIPQESSTWDPGECAHYDDSITQR